MTFIDYTIVIVYLVAMVTLGVLLQKRASSGIDSYFLGNRGMPWWALGASGMASNLDVSGTMINTAWIFALGAAGMFIEIRGGVTLIMAFLMIFMGKWNRRAQVMTMAEWMRFRFGKERDGDVARLMAAISIIIVTIAMITYFAVGSGKFISTFLGIPDIGKITEPFDENEMSTIHQHFNEMEILSVKFNEKIDLKIPDIPERKAVNKAWIEFNQSWDAIKEDPLQIALLTQFEEKMFSFRTVIRSIRSAADREIDTQEDPDSQYLMFYIDQMGDYVDSLQEYYHNAVQYQIIITSRFLAALLMIFLAMIYTVASGLYGVVWTDVFQGFLIFGTIAFICITALTKFNIPEVFSISVPMKDGTFQAIQTTRDAWTNVVPNWKLSFPKESVYSIYNLFGIAILFYLIKVTIEGSGGTSGYMIQRFFASRSDRDAGLLSLFWTFLLSFRWPFIAAIAIMGVAFGASQGVISDPETVLPVVVNELIPTGIKGLLVAGLMAAAMSTFDSTVNAGASYWVKDIYQAYINPKATGKQLMRHSRWASVVLVVCGLLFSLTIRNINEIWGWITMSIGAGMIIPTLVRWYWWRLNGFGFAIGTAAGMIAAVFQRLIFPDIPEYVAFSFASGTSFIAMLIGTYATKPTNESVLTDFYKTTRPFGFWSHVREKIPSVIMDKVNKENRRDKISIFMAVPWQIVLFLMWITVMMKRWDLFGYLIGILIVLSLGLYFTWFRHLSTEVKIEK
jgi:Na+/proline symporter